MNENFRLVIFSFLSNFKLSLEWKPINSSVNFFQFDGFNFLDSTLSCARVFLEMLGNDGNRILRKDTITNGVSTSPGTPGKPRTDESLFYAENPEKTFFSKSCFVLSKIVVYTVYSFVARFISTLDVL